MSRSSKPANLATLFAALADSTRLRLLNLMAGREVCVCYFVEILRQSQPKISRHLAYLRKAGIVAARREGKWMHYSICPFADPAAGSILAGSPLPPAASPATPCSASARTGRGGENRKPCPKRTS